MRQKENTALMFAESKKHTDIADRLVRVMRARELKGELKSIGAERWHTAYGKVRSGEYTTEEEKEAAAQVKETKAYAKEGSKTPGSTKELEGKLRKAAFGCLEGEKGAANEAALQALLDEKLVNIEAKDRVSGWAMVMRVDIRGATFPMSPL